MPSRLSSCNGSGRRLLPLAPPPGGAPKSCPDENAGADQPGQDRRGAAQLTGSRLVLLSCVGCGVKVHSLVHPARSSRPGQIRPRRSAGSRR